MQRRTLLKSALALSATLAATLAPGVVRDTAAQAKPEGEIRFAMYVTLSPLWLDPADQRPGGDSLVRTATPRLSVRVDGLKQTVDLLSRDFPRDEIAYGRSIKRFAIAFNFIGPIADPIGRRR